MKQSRPRYNRLWKAVIIIVIVIAAAYFYPLPFFISSPGAAIELKPIINVENGYGEQGTFMLTTVRMSKANVFNYALATWDEYRETIPKSVLLADYRNENEYSERQLLIMQSSQESAIAVAYELAGKEVKLLNRGVMVVSTVEGMPADIYLKFGDIITSIDGIDMDTSEELVAYIRKKQEGDSVRITYTRDNEQQETTLQLIAFPEMEEAGEEQPRAGIGISTLTKQEVEVDPPVEINTNRIGGPSAGLMFTLEIYNQLTEEDITKGYRIAGTGTISPKGIVGRIGGIHQKIVAADKAGAEIFFAPYEEGAADSNYNRAVQAAEDIGTAMKIVPVDTVQDALQYLESLPQKRVEE